MPKEPKMPQPLLWPRYLDKKWIARTLAYLRVDCLLLVTENGERFECTTFDEFIRLIFEHNLLTFVTRLAHVPWIDDFVRCGVVMCHEQGRPIAASFKGARNTRRHLIEISAWDYVAVTPDVLKELRTTYTHLGVGTPNTPGAAGQAVLRKCWKEEYGPTWKSHRHRRPAKNFCDDLHRINVGARSDLLDASTHPEAIEIDLKNGYAHHFRSMPTGICVRTYQEAATSHLFYQTEVDITIHTPLALGCFPVKRENPKPGEPTCDYPTAAGTYRTHAWNREIELAIERGCSVSYVGWGYAWDEETTDFAMAIGYFEHLRDTAPDDVTAKHVKKVITAAWGRFNLPDDKFVLVPPEEKSELDLPMTANGIPYDWWVHREHDDAPQSMPHFYYYCVMQCRVTLFLEAEKWALQGKLIATNTDAVIVTSDADVSGYAHKSESSHLPTGTWRWELLTGKHTNGVTVPKSRHLHSDQHFVTPGSDKGKRHRMSHVNKSIDANSA